MGSVPMQFWNGTTMRNMPKGYGGTAVISSGQIVIYLTNNGLSDGAAIFNNVCQASLNLYSLGYTPRIDSYSLSNDKKTLTIGLTFIAAELGILSFITPANGTTVYLSIWGD